MSERLAGRTGWVLSILFHGLLVLLFFYSQLELRPFDVDFTPVEFAALHTSGAGESGGNRREGAGSRPQVELPKRPMLEDESPLLRLPDSDRRPVVATSPQTKPDLARVEALRPGQRVDLTPSIPGQRERAPVMPVPLGDDVLGMKGSDVLSERIQGDEMFNISWEGPARVKVSGRLPAFPKNLNEAATVRIAFTVDPDGNVLSAAPITKGLPELEKVSLDALRAWRFNALDAAMARGNQKGVITFIFKLK